LSQAAFRAYGHGVTFVLREAMERLWVVSSFSFSSTSSYSCSWSSRCFEDAAPWSQRHWWRGAWVIRSVSRVSRFTSSMLTIRGCWPAGLSILSQQPLSVTTLRRVDYCLTRETHEGGNMT